MNTTTNILATRYSTDHINVERGMDMLNHYPNFPESERRTPVAISFYHEVLQKWIDKGNRPIVYNKYCDDFEMELGIDKFVQHTYVLADVTLWKEYVMLKDEIQKSCLDHPRHPDIRQTGERLMQAMECVTIDPHDCETVWGLICDMHAYPSPRGTATGEYLEFLKDFRKDITNTIFEKLLPYKFHTAGWSDVAIDGVVGSYLEMLIQMFFTEVQTMRGCNMRNIGHFMKTTESIIYLFMKAIHTQNNDIMDQDMRPFTTYIEDMCNIHVTSQIRTDIYRMVESKPDYFAILDQLHPNSAFLKAMPMTDEFNRYRDHISNKSIDVEWNGWIITGNGYFSDQKLMTRDGARTQINSDFMYAIEKIDSDLIRQYMNTSGVNFQIEPEALMFLKSEKEVDLCKMIKPAVDGYSGEEIRYAVYVPGLGIFVLFQVNESKDVFGIGIVETKNQDRQIIQFGYDKSDNYYHFIFGGED